MVVLNYMYFKTLIFKKDIFSKNGECGVYHVVPNNIIACANSTGKENTAASWSRVVLAEFCGPWVITVDKTQFSQLYAADIKVTGQQMTLRFHLRSDCDGQMTEKAAFPAPHSDEVTALVSNWQEAGALIFTISETEIRSWRFQPSAPALESEWSCHRSVSRNCYLTESGDGAVISSAICRDGSVLAALDINVFDHHNIKNQNYLVFFSKRGLICTTLIP